MGVDIERLSSVHWAVGETRRRWPEGRDHRGNASLFGAGPGLCRVDGVMGGLMLSACD